MSDMADGTASKSAPAKTARRQHSEYSEPDQVARFAQAKAAGTKRVLDIDTVYTSDHLVGKRVVVTGGNRGLGLALTQQLVADGARVVVLCRRTSPQLTAISNVEVIEGMDVTNDTEVETAIEKLGPSPVDILINNAGYFYDGPSESVLKETMNFAEQLKQVDICASGPLRVTTAMVKRGLLQPGSKVVIVTSQAGSTEWRFTQNAGKGGDYGHHMSRAACNIAGVLLSEEVKSQGITVGLLHPGFNRTEMTKRYEAIWDVEGAVVSEIGAKRVLHEVSLLNLDKTGAYINCEDGLPIPW